MGKTSGVVAFVATVAAFAATFAASTAAAQTASHAETDGVLDAVCEGGVVNSSCRKCPTYTPAAGQKRRVTLVVGARTVAADGEEQVAVRMLGCNAKGDDQLGAVLLAGRSTLFSVRAYLPGVDGSSCAAITTGRQKGLLRCPAPGSTARADKVSPGDHPMVMGSLSKEAIRKTVKTSRSEVKQCYEQGLLQNPNLAGRVTVKFTISATGSVVSAVIHQSTLGDQKVEQCILKRVRRWGFPKPKGGGIVIVRYPFELKTS